MNGILSKVLQVGYTRAKCGTCLRISQTYGERSASPIGVGRKYNKIENEIGVVKLKLFSNSHFDFSKLDILLCPKIENGMKN
jgi:phage FluMu protein Com